MQAIIADSLLDLGYAQSDQNLAIADGHDSL